MKNYSGRLIPCFLCGNGLEVRTSKRRKPYFICDPCGVQVFIRREGGIARLDKLLQSVSGLTVDFSNAQGGVANLLGQINQLAELKAKLVEVQNRQGFMEFLTGDGSMALAEKAIKKEIAEIETRLQVFLSTE
ncbi:MAG: hypothetical protein ABSA12_09880 [Verrucomicrobiia bacterium]|jgi:hypothetical protein